MALLIPNSRDIGNKFLFGHWMMRQKDSQLPFIGPGFGRAKYWMKDFDAIEKEMKKMKELGLRAYLIELCGAMKIADGCWDCCSEDVGKTVTLSTHAGEETVISGESSTKYFEPEWYEEVYEKYGKIVKL